MQTTGDIHLLATRLCAWETIAAGRLNGRVATDHVRSALIDLGIDPEESILHAIYDVWFGRWQIESSDRDGVQLEEVVHMIPAPQARAMRR